MQYRLEFQSSVGLGHAYFFGCARRFCITIPPSRPRPPPFTGGRLGIAKTFKASEDGLKAICGRVIAFSKLRNKVSVCRKAFDILCGRAIIYICPCIKAFAPLFHDKRQYLFVNKINEKPSARVFPLPRAARNSRAFPKKLGKNFKNRGILKLLAC